MVSDSSASRNSETIAMLRQLTTDLRAAGKDRSAALAALCRANRQHAHPVSDADLLALIHDLFCPRGGVGAAAKTTPAADPEFATSQVGTRETEETEEPERALTNQNESERTGTSTSLADSRSADTLSSHQEPSEEEGEPNAAVHPSPELPLAEYVARAVDAHQEAGSWDGGGAPWRSPLWHFVRLLTAHPDLATKTSMQAFRAVDKVVRSWRRKTKDQRTDAWDCWLGVSRADAEAEFYGAWDKVRYLPGYDPLENALELARREPLTLNERTQEERPAGYRMFVSLAGWLQVGMGSQPILLPTSEVGKLLRVNPATVSRYRRWAKEDGYLQEVCEHQRPAKGRPGKATRFRFNIGIFPILRERAGEE